MAIRITIRTHRPDPSIPFMPRSLEGMYGPIMERHHHNLISSTVDLSEDGLDQTVVMTWKDLDSLMDWNLDRNQSQPVKEMMLLEYRDRMGISYWSQQELA